MGWPRFRIRTLVLAVAVVALELAVTAFLLRAAGLDRASGEPGRAESFTVFAVLIIACNALVAAIVRDVTRNAPHE